MADGAPSGAAAATAREKAENRQIDLSEIPQYLLVWCCDTKRPDCRCQGTGGRLPETTPRSSAIL